MIEDVFIQKLRADSELSGYVNTFNGAPAIFSDLAHEDAVRPYITVQIEKRPTENLPVDDFYIEVHYWDTGYSRANARAACERVEFIFDKNQASNSRYDNIRFFRDYYRPVEEPDPRNIHYVCQLTARGTRSKWITQLF